MNESARDFSFSVRDGRYRLEWTCPECGQARLEWADDVQCARTLAGAIQRRGVCRQCDPDGGAGQEPA